MSIHAIVEHTAFNEDGSGRLELLGDERGQPSLSFGSAPEDVTALTGKQIWGGSDYIYYKDRPIAKRLGYTRIAFIVDQIAT